MAQKILTPRDEGSRATGAERTKIALTEAPLHEKEDMNPPPPVPPERVAERKAKEGFRGVYVEPTQDSPFQPDWDEDIFTIKDERVVDGVKSITERKARFCKKCQAEVTAGLVTCPNCLQRVDGGIWPKT